MRDRIRARLRAAGRRRAARATEGAFISTIHGFCARCCARTRSPPGSTRSFSVLDQPKRERLADAAFDDALEVLARRQRGGVELIAVLRGRPLRAAILATFASCARAASPRPCCRRCAPAPDSGCAPGAARRQAAATVRSSARVPDPSSASLRRSSAFAAARGDRQPGGSWPGSLEALRLPGGNGAALTTAACAAYAEALDALPRACEHSRASAPHAPARRAAEPFGARYAERKRAELGGRLRGPRADGARPARRRRRPPRRYRAAVRLRDGRRAPGHQ